MDTILIVDDNPGVCTALQILLSLHGLDAVCAHTPAEGLALARDPDIALVIQDMNFTCDTTSGEEGAALFRRLRDQRPDLPIILMTAWTHLEMAVALVKSGAADYLAKPWDDAKLITTVNNLLELSGLRSQNRRLLHTRRQRRQELQERHALCGLVYESEAMQELLRVAVQVAPADVPVLITGESGVGKEKIADILQANSRVRSGPFVKVNCGALPTDLLEAELFGAEAGAYTGANKARPGRFELADQGTLFLDEIGNLPLSGQMKLLRVLQTGEFERLGSGKTQKVSVRVVSATNSDLKQAIRAGQFREDLYYRLNVIELNIPPLRERREDVPPLARHFLSGEQFPGEQFTGEKSLGTAFRLSPSAEQALLAHDWPGNVRELENLLARARLLAGRPILEPRDLGLPEPATRTNGVEAEPELDQATLAAALARADGIVARAAKELGMSRQALYRRMDKFGLVAP